MRVCVRIWWDVLPSPFTLFMADTLWSEIEVIYPETFHLQRKLLRYEGPADVCNTQYFLWPSFSTLWQSVRWQSKQALFSQDLSKEKCEKILRLLRTTSYIIFFSFVLQWHFYCRCNLITISWLCAFLPQQFCWAILEAVLLFLFLWCWESQSCHWKKIK